MSDSSDSEFEDLAAAIRSVRSDEESEDESKSIEDEIEDKNDEALRIKRKRIDSEEQKDLDKFLFGDRKGLIENLEDSKSFFFTDVTGTTSKNVQRATVWHDEDDDEFKKSNVNGETQLKRKFERIAGGELSWAQLDRKVEDDSDDEDDGISTKVGHLAKKSTSKDLPKGELVFKRQTNINQVTTKEGRITAVEFHPKSTVGIVAGTKGMVSMFALDGRENKKIHNIKYERFPIRSCKLNIEGDELIVGSIEKYFHTYNLLSGHKQQVRLPEGINNMKSFELSRCGKYMAVIGELGEIHLLHSLTRELLVTLKQEYPSTSIKFSMDSKKLFAHSDDTEVTVFDLRTQRMEHRFVDDGCVNGLSLALSPNGKFIATGSRQGFVNIYNYDDVLASKYPKPEKALSNLTTEATDINFNATGEILGICSADKDNAVKLVHLPSAMVFSNFPSQHDKIGKATVVSFSPAGGYLSFGTIAGSAPLYRLRHYSNY